MEDINRKDQLSHFFTNAKLYLSIGMTIGVMVLLILIFLNLNYTFSQMAIYVVQTIILYIFAVVSAEFVLLVYCRFKFPSFNITWKQHEKEHQEFIANRKKNKRERTKTEMKVINDTRKLTLKIE